MTPEGKLSAARKTVSKQGREISKLQEKLVDLDREYWLTRNERDKLKTFYEAFYLMFENLILHVLEKEEVKNEIRRACDMSPKYERSCC